MPVISLPPARHFHVTLRFTPRAIAMIRSILRSSAAIHAACYVCCLFITPPRCRLSPYVIMAYTLITASIYS